MRSQRATAATSRCNASPTHLVRTAFSSTQKGSSSPSASPPVWPASPRSGYPSTSAHWRRRSRARYGNALGWDRQESFTLALSSKTQDLAISWGSTFIHGASPFAFDRTEAEHRFHWRLESEARISVRLSGGGDSHKISWQIPYDWEDERLDDSRLDLDVNTPNASIFVSSDVDMNDGTLLSASIDAEFTTSEGWGLSFDALFVPEVGR